MRFLRIETENLNDFKQLNVIDLYGRIVLRKNLNHRDSKNLIRIDVSKLPSGAYAIELLNTSETVIEKFIKN